MTLTPGLDLQAQSQVHPPRVNQLALAAIFLLAGCASSNARTSDPNPNPRLAQLEKKRQALVESEKRCVDEALARNRDELARIAGTPDASVELQTQRANDERDREISQCHARADHENAEIAEQERNEYELEAEKERNRAAHLEILTAPEPR
jgi:hypothetical protein